MDVIRKNLSCQMKASDKKNEGVEEGEVSVLLGVLGELGVRVIEGPANSIHVSIIGPEYKINRVQGKMIITLINNKWSCHLFILAPLMPMIITRLPN